MKKENQQLRVEHSDQVSHIDNKTKIEVIKTNSKKYSISAMCKFLKISRSVVYYKNQTKQP